MSLQVEKRDNSRKESSQNESGGVLNESSSDSNISAYDNSPFL